METNFIFNGLPQELINIILYYSNLDEILLLTHFNVEINWEYLFMEKYMILYKYIKETLIKINWELLYADFEKIDYVTMLSNHEFNVTRKRSSLEYLIKNVKELWIPKSSSPDVRAEFIFKSMHHLSTDIIYSSLILKDNPNIYKFKKNIMDKIFPDHSCTNDCPCYLISYRLYQLAHNVDCRETGLMKNGYLSSPFLYENEPTRKSVNMGDIYYSARMEHFIGDCLIMLIIALLEDPLLILEDFDNIIEEIEDDLYGDGRHGTFSKLYMMDEINRQLDIKLYVFFMEYIKMKNKV